jgi:hypothetical protein
MAWLLQTLKWMLPGWLGDAKVALQQQVCHQASMHPAVGCQCLSLAGVNSVHVRRNHGCLCFVGDRRDTPLCVIPNRLLEALAASC